MASGEWGFKIEVLINSLSVLNVDPNLLPMSAIRF